MQTDDPESKQTQEEVKICIPGMRISESNNVTLSGPGTYELNGYIYTDIAGILKTKYDEAKKANVLSVESPKSPSVLPQMGDIATARVIAVNSRLVQCQILCVGPTVLARPYRAILKKEDIRDMDRDRIDPYKCFRPGDVILARVLPMTELHAYHLTTAENELGVVIATAEGSPQGVSMVPISWSEMQCPTTLTKEPRKVARVIPEIINKEFVLAIQPQLGKSENNKEF